MNPNADGNARGRDTSAGDASAAAPAAPRPSHSGLMAKQNWDAVRRVLASKRGRDQIRKEMRSCALHFSCRFHPPLDVVEFMAKAFPGSLAQLDKSGQCALHIATRDGASPQVIQFLVDEQPDTAALEDAHGKTPLHHACESYANNFSRKKSGGANLKLSLLTIVKILCRAAPDSVNVEDEEDMTALEYAIDADVDYKIVRTMQKACEKDWKLRREQADPGTSHGRLQQQLMEESLVKTEKTTDDLLRETMTSLNESVTSLMNESMSTLNLGEGKKVPMLTLGNGRLPLSVEPKRRNSRAALVA